MNPEDIDLLSKLSKENYVSIFKNAGDTTDVLIGACLLFDKLQNPEPNMRVIAKTAKEALRVIAAESNLNKLRLSRYEIDD